METKNIVFASERIIDVVEEIQPLLWDHYQEVALHKERIKLDPDWPKYFALEEQGSCIVFTMRDRGRLVGYAVFFVSPHIHYQACRAASNDIIYFDPEYRKGLNALRFIRFCEGCLRDYAMVTKVTWHIKPLHDWSPVLARMGYEQEEIVMGKVL